MSENLQDLISDYIEGKMNAPDKASFERLLVKNPELAKEVAELQSIEEGLQALGMEALMEDLKSWEQELPLAASPKANWKIFLSIAAVVTLFIVPAIYLFNSQKPTSEELFLSYYEPYEEMIISRSNSVDSLNTLLAQGMAAYNKGAYRECADFLHSYLQQKADARVSLYLAIAQLELNQQQSAENNFLLAQQDPAFRQQAQWYQALSYLKFSETEKAKGILDVIVNEKNHYRYAKASRLLKELS
jgi:hypothetical protein